MSEYTIKTGFEWASSLHGLMEQFSAEKLEETFDNDGVILKIRCREADYGKLASTLSDTCRGQAMIFKN
jgi:putative IMPACT (imprinted ancient) family translation regulator